MSSETRRRLIGIGIFLVPVVIVKLAGVMLAPADAAAAVDDPAATPVAETPIVTVTPQRELTRAQQAALDHASRLCDEPFGPTPMHYQPYHEQRRPVVVDHTPAQAPLEVRIGALFDDGNGGRALINDRWVRVGDVLAGTPWRVESISAVKRAVTLKHEETGETSERRMAR